MNRATYQPGGDEYALACEMWASDTAAGHRGKLPPAPNQSREGARIGGLKSRKWEYTTPSDKLPPVFSLDHMIALYGMSDRTAKKWAERWHDDGYVTRKNRKSAGLWYTKAGHVEGVPEELPAIFTAHDMAAHYGIARGTAGDLARKWRRAGLIVVHEKSRQTVKGGTGDRYKRTG